MNKRFVSSVSIALLALSLVACGGGRGGGGGETPPPAPVLPQGLWVGESMEAAYVLPTATGAGEVWAFRQDAVRGTLFGTLQVSGSGFAASTARYLDGFKDSTTYPPRVADAQVSLTSAGATLSLTASILALNQTISINNMTASPTYEQEATMNDWDGNWNIVDGNQQKIGTFTVSSGRVSGGLDGYACEYSGTVTLRPEKKSVVNVEFQETKCPEGLTLSGIGTFVRSPDGAVAKDRRMLALKNADNSLRSLVGLLKPN